MPHQLLLSTDPLSTFLEPPYADHTDRQGKIDVMAHCEYPI